MANYNSIHTGSVIDNVISNALLKSEAANIYLTKSDAASIYLTQTNAASIYLTKADASNIYPTKTGGGASGTWNINISGNATTASSVSWTNISNRPNDLYVIQKSTSDKTTITITIPGHANTSYDRIMIWAFGNMNGTPYYGIIRTTSDSTGANPTATWTGNYTPSCTYANSGSNRVITVNDLPSWGTVTLMSCTQIA